MMNIRMSMNKIMLNKNAVEELHRLDEIASVTDEQLSTSDHEDDDNEEDDEAILSSLFGSKELSRRASWDGRATSMVESDVFVQEECKKMLKTIRRSIDDYAQHERELRKALRIHLDKAKARMESDNQQGAIISMRRVHKMRSIQGFLLNAIGSLRTLELDVEGFLGEKFVPVDTRKSFFVGRNKNHRLSITDGDVQKFVSFRAELDRIKGDEKEQQESSMMFTTPAHQQDSMISELRNLVASR